MKDIIMNAVIAFALTATVTMLNEGLKSLKRTADCWIEKLRDDADKNDQQMKVMLFKTAKQFVDTTTYNMVAAMEQMKAKDIRDRVKLGLASKADLEILATDVLYSIKDQITPDVAKIMGEYVADMDTYLQNQIESALLSIKNASPYIDIAQAQVGALEVQEANPGSGS